MMPSNVVKLPTHSWSHCCDRFVEGRSLKFCYRCGYARVLHPRLVSCSGCGEAFTASEDEEGFDGCAGHANREAVE